MANIFLSANKSQIERMNQLFSYIRESRPLDSIIRTKDTVDTDKYTVDIFESGYGQPATKMAIDAFAISPSEAYEVNWPAKINYKDGSAFIRPELYPLFLKPKTPVDTSVNNRIEGWPCDQDGACDASISDPAKTIFINFAFPGTETGSNPDPSNTMAWMWFKYPRPVTVESYKAAGVVLFGAAAGSTLTRVIATSPGTVGGRTIKVKPVQKDTTTAAVGAAEFDVQLLQGHGIGDIFWATKTANGTDFTGVDWIEHFMLVPGGSRYRLVQIVDSTGRLGIDSARYE